jgi:hypothetical protein
LHAVRLQLLIVALLGISLVTVVPIAHAQACLPLQIQNVNNPSTVAPSQSFELDTQISVCGYWKDYVNVRVDVIDLPSNTIISKYSYTFPLSAFASGGSASTTIPNQLTAPSIPISWSLKIQATLYYQYPPYVLGTADETISIQVGPGQANEQSTNVPLIQNGGFENGFAGWQTTKGTGTAEISSQIVHSGSSSLRLYMPPVAPPGISFSPSMTITQVATVNQLRDLTVEAWADGPLRLQAKLEDLVVDYDFGGGWVFMSIEGMSSPSTIQLASSAPCNGMWCYLQRDVATDVQPYLASTHYASIFNSDKTVTVTISVLLLQFFNFYQENTAYVTYVDDVQAFAQVPAAITTTSTTLLSAEAVTTSSSMSSSLLTSSYSPIVTSIAYFSGTTSTVNGPAMSTDLIYVTFVAIFAIALVAVIFLLARTRRGSHPKEKRGQSFARCSVCGADMPSSNLFCTKCGSKIT